ncbi:MAG: metal-dependent transcriptional regulator [Chloroflexota bacterium]
MQTFCGLTTDGMQEYLATIYRLKQDLSQDGENSGIESRDVKITTRILAEKMNVSSPAVSSMLKRLETMGFIERSHGKGITLSEQGRLQALRMIRRHRLLEVFLIEVMGFTWDQVDSESHRLEHAISSAFEERMDKLCGYPIYCPHGDPIPRLDGTMPPHETLMPLTQVKPGAKVILRRVGNKEPQVLRYLAQCHLRPGNRLRLIEHAPFKGPITFELLNQETTGQSGDMQPNHAYEQRGHTQMLGSELADQLFVAITDNE